MDDGFFVLIFLVPIFIVIAFIMAAKQKRRHIAQERIWLEKQWNALNPDGKKKVVRLEDYQKINYPPNR